MSKSIDSNMFVVSNQYIAYVCYGLIMLEMELSKQLEIGKYNKVSEWNSVLTTILFILFSVSNRLKWDYLLLMSFLVLAFTLNVIFSIYVFKLYRNNRVELPRWNFYGGIINVVVNFGLCILSIVTLFLSDLF